MRAAALVLLCAACGSKLSREDPAPTLVRVDEEPPGATCPLGGLAVHSGADANRNGLLDDGEITSTEVFCHPGEDSWPGNHTIREPEDADLLAGIVTVTGSLIIEAPDLVELSLPELVSIGGSLTIANNRLLEDLDGLANVTSVGGSITITNNASLTSLGGLAGVTSVGYGLHVASNPLLVDLVGLEGITAVSFLTILNNPALESVDGLDNLAYAGSVSMDNNPKLGGVAGLGALAEVGSYFNLNRSPALGTLAGLASLAHVGGTLMITTCESLETVGVPALDTLGGLYAYSNASLTGIGLDAVVAVSGDVSIRSNGQLAAIDLDGVETIGGSVSIAYNALPAGLDGFSSLTEIGGDFEVASNNQLLSVAGPDVLVAIGGGVSIDSNANLTALHLGALREVGSDLRIRVNPSLPTCDAERLRDQLTTLGGAVVIELNGSGACP